MTTHPDPHAELNDGGPMRLAIDQCSRHKFWAISIGDNHSGERITPSKCCGQWTTVREWNLSESDWLRIAELARLAAAHEAARKVPK